MTRGPQWPRLAGVLLAIGAVCGVFVSARRAVASLAARADASAAHAVAGYLSLTVRRDGSGGYDLPRLLSAVNLVESSQFWRAGLQVAAGNATLLPDALSIAPLPATDYARLRSGQADVRVLRQGRGVTVVPLLDADQWETVGWVAAWTRPSQPVTVGASRGILAACLLSLGVAALFAQSLARRPIARLAALVPIALAVAIAIEQAASVRSAAEASTDAALRRAAGLAALADLAGGATEESLARIAPGMRFRIGVERASGGVLRSSRDGSPEAYITIPLHSGHSSTISIPPAEAGLDGTYATFVGWLLLFAAGVALAMWAGADRTRRAARETLSAWCFLAPAFSHLLLFSFGPVAFAVYLSLHRWGLVEPGRPFVGLENYGHVLADGAFWHSLGITALYSLYVPATAVLALGCAVVLQQGGLRTRLLRTVLFLPFISSVVAVALVWQWMYQPDFGLVNAVLARFGIAGPDWLGNPRTALLALMLLSAWVQLGYQTVLLLAGLQQIPGEYLDAARIDGASAWQRFRHVTLPLLRPTVLFVLVTGIITSFQVFTYVSVMTEGGPLYATDVIVFRIYREAWEFLRFGSASAMSLLLLVVLVLATWLQFRWLGKRVEIV